jgi:hypothetical protein
LHNGWLKVFNPTLTVSGGHSIALASDMPRCQPPLADISDRGANDINIYVTRDRLRASCAVARVLAGFCVMMTNSLPPTTIYCRQVAAPAQKGNDCYQNNFITCF